MYSLDDYGRMLLDDVRVEAYVGALREVVRPGAIVVDIGTGTGFFAMVAARLGARKVYALEPDPVVHVARRIVRANGLADRITCLEMASTELELDERADVIVSDLRGRLPLFGRHLASLHDAKRRLLKEGGAILPAADHLVCAPASAPDLHARLLAPWSRSFRPESVPGGLDMSLGASHALNKVEDEQQWPVTPAQLLAAPVRFATLRYGDDAGERVSARISFTAEKEGRCHGLSIWFDAEIRGAHGFSTGPGFDRIYRRAFFPLEQPVALSVGTRLEVDLIARPSADDHTWGWTTTVFDAEGKPTLRQAQTSFYSALAMPLPGGDLPRLTDEGEATLRALSLAQGDLSTAEIASRLQQEFSSLFNKIGSSVPWTQRTLAPLVRTRIKQGLSE